MDTYPEQITWLQRQRHTLQVVVIEKECKLPEGTLSKFLRGERGLRQTHWKKVCKWVDKHRKLTP